MGSAILGAAGLTNADDPAVAQRGQPEALEALDVGLTEGVDNGDVETPRIGAMERERGNFLALQLSGEHHQHQHRASIGGWGLGAGKEERMREEEDDDEAMDWDQAQVKRPQGIHHGSS